MSIFLEASDSSNVTANNISDNDFGIRISYSDDVTASRNTVANNGALGYESSGINLDYSDNATVKGNIIKNNARAISLYKSTSNYLHGNNITDNEQGIWLDWYSTDNKISSNIVANNDGYGISIQTLSNATIEGNNIVNNGWGIFLFSFGNMIYHNNFINNTEQAINYHERMKNTWDAGYPSGGNFWSDYTDSDANGDGIGNTPYVIDADNQDRYPLMRPWNSFVLYGDVNGDGTVNILDVILVSKAFGTSQGDLNYDPSSDLNQDGRINILDMILVAKHFGQHIP
jgi:parallel beta-helix repeat protein